MPETIEAFVQKIRAEGVEAGQKQADDLLAQARRQADDLLAQAQREKKALLAGAQAEADRLVERGRTELDLAARDAVLRLRDALGRVLRDVLSAEAATKLADPEFIGKVLHEIVMAYARADLEGKPTFRVNVPEEMRERLVAWALKHIGGEGIEGGHISIDLKGTLKQAGFEYGAAGATVEVTLESVVAVLADLVSPALRETIDRAVSGSQPGRTDLSGD